MGRAGIVDESGVVETQSNHTGCEYGGTERARSAGIGAVLALRAGHSDAANSGGQEETELKEPMPVDQTEFKQSRLPRIQNRHLRVPKVAGVSGNDCQIVMQGGSGK